MIRLPVLLSVLAFAAFPAAAQVEGAPSPQAAWTEMTGQGAEVRVAAGPGGCPEVKVDGQSMSMIMRAPASADFPAVCQLALPAGVGAVEVDGKPLPLPRPVKRIVIFGDTGCRIKNLAVQACNTPQAWPFPEVVRLAAAQKPDLVIHVGDYYYRETPCPLDIKACAGSPYGDHWATWQAEFFDPAAPLLSTAPWVFARGNHEVCGRGGRGWYMLLDAGATGRPCLNYTEPFAVRVGDLNLYVIDSGQSPDREHKPVDTAALANQLDALGAGLESGQGWIITHRPVWGLVPVARLGPADPFQVGLNFTEQDAVRGRALKGVQMIVSGHVHHFQAIDFGAARPAQLVVGTGGDIGEAADLPRIYGGDREIDGLDASTFSFSRFGYYVMDKDGEDWTGTFRDYTDQVRAQCRLHGRELKCEAPKRPKTVRPAG